MPPKRAPRAQPLKGGASKRPFHTLAYIGAAVCILVVIASMSSRSQSSAPSKDPSSSSPAASSAPPSASQPAAHPAPGPEGQLAEQMRINRSTQKAWHLFASHRARVQSLLLGLLRRIEKEQRAREKKGLPRDTAPSDCHSLCVLGAGNSNDLDLAVLTGTAPLPESEANKKRPPSFAEVHLVDLDGDSLLQGVRKQFERMPPLPDSEQMLMKTVLHGAVDLMGLLTQEAPSKWRPSAPADNADVSRAVGVLRQDLERPILAGLNITLSDELFARLQSAAPLPPAEPGAEWGNFSVVLSACLVTQFYEQVGHSLGFQHAGAAAVMAAVRARHLASMMQALRPGGWGLLVSDMVSSLSWPELEALPDDPDTLLSAMKEQADKKNHFHMSHPWRVLEQLEDARSIYSRWVYPGSVALLRPWKWRLADSKTYLVFAIEFQRRHVPDPNEADPTAQAAEPDQDAADAEPAHSEL